VAIDGSDLPAHANGQRYLSKNGPERERYSDPDASWGHRSAAVHSQGGGYYGYKVHAAVDVATDLPLAWTVETAKDAEQTFALGLLDAARERGFEIKTAIMDAGYDSEPIHGGCMDRGLLPVTPLRERPASSAARTSPHAVAMVSGRSRVPTSSVALPSGAVRRASASPASTWVKASRLHPLIPRESERSAKLYRSRGAVEREFGRLKNEWAMAPLRVRRVERVRLHVDLTILAKLSCALARTRAVPLAA
jgi:hypothetical protein